MLQALVHVAYNISGEKDHQKKIGYSRRTLDLKIDNNWKVREKIKDIVVEI